MNYEEANTARCKRGEMKEMRTRQPEGELNGGADDGRKLERSVRKTRTKARTGYHKSPSEREDITEVEGFEDTSTREYGNHGTRYAGPKGRQQASGKIFCTERGLWWLARPGRKALARQAFFREGREHKTKFNRGLSTAARSCPPLPYLNETWQPRYRQTQSRGLCLIPEGCTVAVWGLEHDGLSTGGGLGEGFICRSDW